MKEQRKTNKTKKMKKGGRGYSKRARDKWFCQAFKLAFLQLICKASWIFKSSLELALSTILKGNRIIWAKASCGGVSVFKNMRLVIVFDMFLNLSFKMTLILANIVRTTASTSTFIY